VAPTDSSPSPDILAGLASLQKGDITEARAALEMALAAEPDSANALQLLGATYLRDAELEKGIDLIQRALAVKPDHAGALNNLGYAYFAQGKFPEAAVNFERALAVKPENPATHYNLANAYFSSGRLGDAATQYRTAYRLQPDFGQALGLYVHCSRLQCSWSDTAARDALTAMAGDGTYTGPPFLLHSLMDDPAVHLGASRSYVKQLLLPGGASPPAVRAGRGRIRVAYVSRDFRRSAVAHLVAGLFEDHDRSRFEIYGISLSPDDGSDLRRRLERGVDRFIDVSAHSDKGAADLMRGLEIDIAVDLNGHTEGNRMAIFAHRPVPIQVGYLGFGGTTGCDAFDYVIVDSIVVPQDRQPFYSEKLWPLRGCYLPVDGRRIPAAATPALEACGLPDDGFIFCSFNNTYKIGPEIFDIWMRLLRKVEGSVLWLAGGSADAETNLRGEAADRGINPARLVFAPKLAEISEHLARYRLADLFLDTFPYNAATTASDALWMGLPVLTLSGKTYASRMAGSILHAAGLPELVATSAEDYENLAMSLATQPKLLAVFRDRLSQGRATSALFDSDRHRLDMEAAFEGMIGRYLSKDR